MSVQDPKSPWLRSNFVGIELEFISKYDYIDLEEKLQDLDEFVHLKADHSIDVTYNYPESHELCICVPERKYKPILQNVLDRLDQCSVNTSCGLHIHLDMRNRDLQTCYNRLYRNQQILYAMNPANRYVGKGSRASGGGFAKKNTPNVWNLFLQNKLKKKYLGLNPKRYHDLKTLEVRIHTGTLSYKKITNWVDILLGIIESDKDYKAGTKDPYIFCSRYGLSLNIARYVDERIKKFNRKGVHITVEE